MSCTILVQQRVITEETQPTHTANWDNNLGWLIARLPSLLYLGSLSTEYVVNSWLQFLELFSWDTVIWQTVHNSLLSLAAFAYEHPFILLPLHILLFCLIQVLDTCDSQRHHFTAGEDLSHLDWRTRSSQLWFFPSHCPYAGADVGSGSPFANHELILRSGTFHLDTLTKAAELHVTACLVGPFQIQ